MRVLAEVAGKVWKLEAKSGATLAAGDTILILESMKMEIPVIAPGAGKLIEIRVGEGESVSEGDLLAIMG